MLNDKKIAKLAIILKLTVEFAPALGLIFALVIILTNSSQ